MLFNKNRSYMNRNVLYVVLVIFCIACTERKVSDTVNVKQINIKTNEIIDDVSISELVSEYKFVVLESTDESLLGQIDKVELFDDYIYVLDSRNTKKVLRFSRSGKFLNKISAIGNGPGEYLLPDDISINQKTGDIAILDQTKVSIFSPENKFIRTVKLPIYAYKFIWYDNRFAFYNRADNDLVVTDDVDGKQLSALFKNDERKKLVLNYPFQLIDGGEDVLYFTNLEYSIYKLSGNSVKSHVKFNFENNMFSDSHLDKLQNEPNSVDDFVQIKYCNETSTHIFMVYLYKRVPYFVLFNKLDSVLKTIDMRGIKNDLTYTLEPPLIIGVYDDYFIAKFDYSNIVDKESFAVNMVDNNVELNDMSNPILLFFKFK